jgi:hypothetical protein
MKNAIVLSIVAAAFTAAPALAQVYDTPQPSRSMPGTGTEQRDDNVWRGAEQSAEPDLYTGRSSVSGAPIPGTDATAGPGITGEMYNPNGFDQNGVPGAQFESDN